MNILWGLFLKKQPKREVKLGPFITKWQKWEAQWRSKRHWTQKRLYKDRAPLELSKNDKNCDQSAGLQDVGFPLTDQFHGVGITDGMIFGSGKYKCLQVTTNQRGICLNSQHAETDLLVQEAMRQQKLQIVHVQTTVKRKQCKQPMKNYILGLHNRSSSVPACTSLAKHCTPWRYFFKSQSAISKKTIKNLFSMPNFKDSRKAWLYMMLSQTEHL